ncbi:MAG: pilus assembly protein PilM [Bacilli bacterium]
MKVFGFGKAHLPLGLAIDDKMFLGELELFGNSYGLDQCVILPIQSPRSGGGDASAHDFAAAWPQHVDDLKRAVRDHGWRGRRVAISLPAEQVILRHLSMPRLPKGKLKLAIRAELATSAPLPFDDPIYDFGVAQGAFKMRQETDGDLDVVVIAASRGEIDWRVDLARQSGLRPVLVEPGLLSAHRATMLLARDVPGLHAFVVLRENGVEFGVFDGHDIMFMRQVAVRSADYIVSQFTRILIEDEQPADVFDHQAYVVDLGYELDRSINFVQYNLLQGGQSIPMVYVLPGFWLNENALAHLSERLEQQVVVATGTFAAGVAASDELTASGVKRRGMDLVNISMGLSLWGVAP